MGTYESYEVFLDEVGRTLDLLEHIDENISYFSVRIGDVAAFLPRNQPLYALTCFVLVPSLMATGVHFRVPAAWRSFFSCMARILGLSQHFPNIHPSLDTRTEFLRQRLARLCNVDTGQSLPLTEAVIFTGVPKHARDLRARFDDRTLFISNGAGHNPVVVTETADLTAATEAVAALCLYNQGQDCAAPNSILVAHSVAAPFVELLKKQIENTAIGPFRDRRCRVGPISDPGDLPRISEFLTRHRRWIIHGGHIDVQSGIISPAIFKKPLREGGNYTEAYAPFIFLQEYDCDCDLANYFESAEYAEHAMYVTVYGESPYVRKLLGREINGRVLHREETLLFDLHLHAEGIERGTKPYGGYGAGASSLSFGGRTIAQPTLPQRDIANYLAAFDSNRPRVGRFEVHCERDARFSASAELDAANQAEPARIPFVDTEMYKREPGRFVPVDDRVYLRLLSRPNRVVLRSLSADRRAWLSVVASLIQGRAEQTLKNFSDSFYQTVRAFPFQGRDRERMRVAFQLLYQLFFAQDTGPKLDQFLWDVDQDMLLHLLEETGGEESK